MDIPQETINLVIQHMRNLESNMQYMSRYCDQDEYESELPDIRDLKAQTEKLTCALSRRFNR